LDFSYDKFNKAEMTSKWSLMIIGSGIIRQHTCYFLLVVHFEWLYRYLIPFRRY